MITDNQTNKIYLSHALKRDCPELMNGDIMKPIRQFVEDATLHPSPKEIEKAKHAVDVILRHGQTKEELIW
jgi:hypothetical protein